MLEAQRPKLAETDVTGLKVSETTGTVRLVLTFSADAYEMWISYWVGKSSSVSRY